MIAQFIFKKIPMSCPYTCYSDQRSVSFAAEKRIFGRIDRRIVMRARSFLSMLEPF